METELLEVDRAAGSCIENLLPIEGIGEVACKIYTTVDREWHARVIE